MRTFNLQKHQVRQAGKPESDHSITEGRFRKEKYPQEPNAVSEQQLKEYRSRPGTAVTMEARLEAVRSGAADIVTERQLDTRQSKWMSHRNADAHSGDFNKLEEQRMKAKNRQEKEAQEAVSEMDKSFRFYEAKPGDDGLKLASSRDLLKTAAEEDDWDFEPPPSRRRSRRLQNEFEDPLAEEPIDKETQELLRQTIEPLKDLEIPDEPPADVTEEELSELGYEGATVPPLFQESIETQDIGGTKYQVVRLTGDLDNFVDESDNLNHKEVLETAERHVHQKHPDHLADQASFTPVSVDSSNRTVELSYLTPVAGPTVA